MSSTEKPMAPGGIKGFFQRAGKSFWQGGMWSKDTGLWLAKKAAYVGFVVATTSMVTLMPLLFEIGRERQSLESDKIQVKQLRSQGFSDRQLFDMGFTESAVHKPSISLVNK
eukprot:CAMPEP_0194048808 /NCGR_PEP_ID=MMETSP0009_2-20130614/28608_1 /TAXON_ID=210454 /ORGANISM="Grammatophora oceanica, Strain CCMP 410" /LENGTH=111 /DNA_ID=CAMNT_0038694797 /DNA_START=104 /DNA_END=439 /DNA_ORIENTATION=+